MLFKLISRVEVLCRRAEGCRWEHSQNAQSDQSGIEADDRAVIPMDTLHRMITDQLLRLPPRTDYCLRLWSHPRSLWPDSAPSLMAMPMFAAESAGESLIPSPIMMTLRPAASFFFHKACLILRQHLRIISFYTGHGRNGFL